MIRPLFAAAPGRGARRLVLALALVLAGAAAAQPPPLAPRQVIVVLPPPPPGPGPGFAPERIVLRTVGGDIVIALYADVAPQTVRQMEILARAGVYDTTHFLRIEPQGYYLQLADARNRLLPMTAAQAAAIHPLKAEWGRLRHVRGAVSLVRSPHEPDSGLTSFLIVRKDAPFLDQPGDTYTIFGKVERGMDVVDALSQVRRSDDGTPELRLTVLQAAVADAAALAALPLRGPVPLEVSVYTAQKAPEVPASERLDWIAAGGFGAILACALGAFLLIRRWPEGRRANALCLLALAIAGYMLLILLTPISWTHAWLGAGLLALTLGIIRLLAFFES